MGRKIEMNSSAGQIRKVLNENGWDVSPKEVISNLEAKGIIVSPQQVSNEKSKKGDITISILKKVKKLVDEVGSTDFIRKALDELDILMT